VDAGTHPAQPRDVAATADGSGMASVWGMGLLLVGFVGCLMLPGGGGVNLAMAGGLGALTLWVPAAVCWVAVYRTRARRLHVFLAAAAVTSYTVANAFYVVALPQGETGLFLGLADVGFIGFYPLMLAALAVLVHRQVAGWAWSVWLDSLLGSLGAASVLALVLGPVLGPAFTEPFSLGTAVDVASPLLDLLLVAAIAGIAASQGLDLGRRWMLLVIGLVAFAVTDVGYAFQVANDSYVVGTPLDAGWAIGLTLVAMWVAGAARPSHTPRRVTNATKALAVPAIATTAGLAVLLVGTGCTCRCSRWSWRG